MMRIGQGFDVHAFGTGDHVMLAGVRVPHSHGLMAHSDGDVAIHALCDALLGALSLGDIGQHFPPAQARWKDVESRKLMVAVVRMLDERGYRVGNADVTIICERPRLAQYVPQMRSHLAADLGCPVDAVSVKATTTDTLGFTGRGEGIAALAIALLHPRGPVSP